TVVEQRQQMRKRDRSVVVVLVIGITRPHDANAHPAVACELAAPTLARTRRRAKIARARWHVVERCRQDAWQAQQRAMTIELRQRLSETRALHSRGQGIAAEPRQRRWQVENDAVTALRNQGHVAEELNCIANPL